MRSGNAAAPASNESMIMLSPIWLVASAVSHRRFAAREPEHRQCDVVADTFEAHLNWRTDGEVRHVRNDDACQHAHALVELDHADRIRHPRLESGMRGDMTYGVGVDPSSAAGLHPVELVGQASRAETAWIKLMTRTGAAVLDLEPAFERRPPVVRGLGGRNRLRSRGGGG